MTDTSLSIRLDTTQIRAGIADLNNLDQSSLRTQAALRQMGDATSTASQRMIAGMSGASSAAQIAARATFEATGSMTAGMSSTATATQVAAERMSASLAGMASASRASMSAMTESIMHNMQQMNASISQLVSGLQQSQNAIRETGAAAGSASNGFNSMNIGAAGLVYTLANMAAAVLKTNQTFEDLGIRAKGVFGSAEAGAHALQQAMEYDLKSPFDLAAITQGMINLKNFGIAPTREVMQSLLDTAAKTGQGTEGLNSLVMQLTQAFGKGHLQMVDWNIMASRGVPVMEALRHVTGKTTGEIMKMGSEGTITKDIIYEMVVELGNMSKGSGVEAMNSLTGSLSNLSSAWEKLKNAIIDTEGASGKFIRNLMGLSTAIIDAVSTQWIDPQVTSSKKMIDINNQILASKEKIKSFENIKDENPTWANEKKHLAQLMEQKEKIFQDDLKQKATISVLDKKAEQANKEAIKKDPESINYAQITKDKKSEIDQQLKDIQTASDQKIAIIKQEKEKIDAIYANDKSDPKGHAAKLNALTGQETNIIEASLQAQNEIINKGIEDINKNAPSINLKFDAKELTGEAAKFAEKYGSAAEIAAKKLNVSVQSILGQFALETGYGRSIIPGTNNLGNIKDFSGKGIKAFDKAEGSHDSYRVYASLDDFFISYVDLIKRKYPQAMGAKSNEAFASALKAGGYATDPNYVKSLSSVAGKFGGTQIDEKAQLETKKAINELTEKRIENENKLALATGKTTVEQIKNNAELKKTLDSYITDPTEIYRLAIDDLNRKQASGAVVGANYTSALDKINETYYKASEAVSKAGSAMDKYTEAQAKANTYLDNTGDMQGWVNLINKADEAFQKTDAAAIAYNETLEKQAKAKAELAGLEQTLSNTSYLVEMAKKLQIEGKTTEEIKKQIDLQQQLDRLKAKNPLIDESKAKSIISQNEEKTNELKALAGGAAKETETAFKRAQENIQDGFATMFENMLNGDALASFDSFISNITKAFNKAIAQDFSTALGSLFKKGATDWGGIFSGVLMSGVSMLGSWLSGSDKAKPTTAMTTTNKNILGQAQLSIADTAGRNINEVASLPALQRLNSAIDVAGTAIRENAGKIWDFSSKYLSKMTSYLFGDAAMAAITKVTSSVSSMYNTVVGWGNKLIGGVKEIVGQAGSFISGTVLGGAAGTAVANGTNGVNGAAGNAAGNAAANAGSNTVSYIGIGLSIVKLGYDLFTIAGNKFMTTTDKVVAGLSSAGDAAFGIGISLAATGVGMPAAIVAFAVAAGAKVISAVTDVIANGFNLENSITLGMTAIGTMILPGIGTIIGAMLGSIFGSLLAKPPTATVLSYSIPDSNARKVSDENGDYHVSSGGKSGTVGVTTAFGEVDMRLNNISKNSGLMIEEATKAFLPLLRTIQAFDGALANSIRVVDATYGQDSFKDFKIKAEHEQKLSKLDTSGFVSDRLGDIGTALAATGTKAGDTFNTWWSAFSAKLLKPNGKENSSYNTATSFNIEAFIASELPKLAELPKSLATLFVKSVKSVADGATQKEFEGQMNDFFMGWQIAKGGLKEIGIQIQDTALPEYLTSLVGIGMTVKESASTLVAFAATFDAAAGDVTAQFNTAFKGIFDNAKKNAYNNDQTVGYVGSYISLSNAAKQTGLSVTPDELNTLSVSLNTAASSAITTANGVIDQAIATANLGNISRDAAIQQLALSGALTSEQIAAGSFSKALVEQQKIMLGGIDFAQQQAVFFGTNLSNMGLTFNDVANIGFNITNTFKDLAEAMNFLDSIAKNVFSPTEYASGKKAQAQATFDTSAKALGFKDFTTEDFNSFYRDKSDKGYTSRLLNSDDSDNAALRNLGAAYNILTEAQTNYTSAVTTAAKETDDTASKAKALKEIYADVNSQLAQLNNTFAGNNIANGILEINNAIQILIDNAMENGGTISNIEELRKAKLKAYTKTQTDPLDDAFKAIDKSPLRLIADDLDKQMAIIGQLFNSGLLDMAQSATQTSQIIAVAQDKAKKELQPFADELEKISKTNYQSSLDGIGKWVNDMVTQAPLIAAAWGKTTGEVLADINLVASERKKALDKELQDILRNTNQAYARSGKSDFEQSLWTIRDNFVGTITTAAQAGASYEQLLSIAATGARTAGDAFQKASVDLKTSAQAKSNALTDKIYTLNGGTDLNGLQAARAMADLQSSDLNKQAAAVDTLISLNDERYQKEINNVKTLSDYLHGLLINDKLSILTPEQKRDTTKADYDKYLAGAKKGDQTSIDKLGGAADAYLTQQLGLSRTSAEYARVFSTVRGDIEKLTGKGTTEDQVKAAQIQQVKELQGLQQKLADVTKNQTDALVSAFNAVGADFVSTLQGFADAAGLEKNVSFDLSELIITDKSKESLEAFKASVITALDSGLLSDADAAMFKASSIGLVENVAGMIVKGQLQPGDVDVILNSGRSVIENMGKLINAGKITSAEANVVYQSSIGVFNHLRELVDLQLISGEVATQVYQAQTRVIDTFTGFILAGKITAADAGKITTSTDGLMISLMDAYKAGRISKTAIGDIYTAQGGVVTAVITAIASGTIKGKDIALISGAVSHFSDTMSTSIGNIKLSPADSNLFSDALTGMSGVLSRSIASKNFTPSDIGILSLGLSEYAANPSGVLAGLNFSPENLKKLKSSLTAAADNPAEVFRLLGFTQENQDRLKAGLGDLSTNTGGALGAVTPGVEALTKINKGVDVLADNIGGGLSAVDWLQAPGDIVRGGVSALATNIGGGLGAVSIDNSGINGAVRGLMSSVAAQIANAQSQASTIIANSQSAVTKPAAATNSDPVAAFDASFNLGTEAGYKAAANIAKAAGYSNQQIAEHVASLGGNADNTLEWLKINGFAKGGRYPGGMALVGEEGPELINFESPGQVYTANQTRNLFGGGDNKAIADLVKELKLLKDQQKRSDDENKQLQIKIAMYLKNISDLTEKSDVIGAPPVRV